MIKTIGVLVAVFLSYFSYAVPLKTSLPKPFVFKQVNLATGTNYFPFVDQNMPEGGWSAAIVDAVFKQLNVKADTKILPWNRVLLLTENAQYDGAYAYISSEQRRAKFYYSDAINFVPVSIVVRRDLKVSNLDSLADKVLCLPHGYALPTSLQKFSSNLKKTHAQNTMGCLQKVAQGWGDIVLVNEHIDKVLLTRNAKIKGKLKLLPDKIPAETLHFIVSKQHPNGAELIRQFNVALKELKASGELENINERFELWVAEKFNL